MTPAYPSPLAACRKAIAPPKQKPTAWSARTAPPVGERRKATAAAMSAWIVPRRGCGQERAHSQNAEPRGVGRAHGAAGRRAQEGDGGRDVGLDRLRPGLRHVRQ